MSETEVAQAAMEYADNRMNNIAAATLQNHLGTYGAGLVREMLAKAFIAGVHHDVNERRACYVASAGVMPRAQVRAGVGFLGDPSSALVLRGRLLPGTPKPGHSPQMIVTVDARRGLADIVAIDVDGAELSRMLNDLNTLVVYGGRNG